MICTDAKLAAPTPNFFRIGHISHELSVNRQSVRFLGEEEGYLKQKHQCPGSRLSKQINLTEQEKRN